MKSNKEFEVSTLVMKLLTYSSNNNAKSDLIALCLKNNHHPDDAFFPLIDYIRKPTNLNIPFYTLNLYSWKIGKFFNIPYSKSSFDNPFCHFQLPDNIYRLLVIYEQLSESHRFIVHINSGKCFHELKEYRNNIHYDKILKFYWTRNPIIDFNGFIPKLSDFYLDIVKLLNYDTILVHLIEDIFNQSDFINPNYIKELNSKIHYELYKIFKNPYDINIRNIIDPCRNLGLNLRYDNRLLMDF